MGAVGGRAADDAGAGLRRDRERGIGQRSGRHAGLGRLRHLEVCLQAAAQALLTPTADLKTANKGFVRQGDRVIIVLVSDSDDHSAPAMTAASFIQDVGGMAKASSAEFHAIMGPTPSGCSSADGDAYAGTIYNSVVSALGGKVFSICDSDWGPNLEVIGRTIAGIPDTFVLDDRPDLASMRVWIIDGVTSDRYDGVGTTQFQGRESVADACDRLGLHQCFLYSVTGKKLTLTDFAPRPPSTVHVEYDLAP